MTGSPWKHGRDPDPNRMAVSEITSALYEGNLEKFTEILERNEWYESQVDHFLLLASMGGHANIVRFLLTKGVKIGGAPFGAFNDMLGPKSRDLALSVLEAFTEYGWKPNDPDNDGFMILRSAMSDEFLVRWLLDHGASPNYGYYPGAMTRWLTTRPGSGQVRSAKEEAMRIKQLTTELIQNASETDTNEIKQSVTSRISQGNLMRFHQQGIDPVTFYFRNKAVGLVKQERPPAAPVPDMELDMKKHPPYSNSGDSLNSAAMHGNIVLFNLLIERGAKLENSFALHDATATDKIGDLESIQMLDYLLALGLDINSTDEVRGFYSMGTPLHYAVYSMKLERARFLIERGADPDKTNWLEKTPIDWLDPGQSDSEEFVKLFGKTSLKASEEFPQYPPS